MNEDANDQVNAVSTKNEHQFGVTYTDNTAPPIWGVFKPNHHYGGLNTIQYHDPVITILSNEVQELKRIVKIILDHDENPELLAKYKQLKEAYDHYIFLRNMILKEEEKKLPNKL